MTRSDFIFFIYIGESEQNGRCNCLRAVRDLGNNVCVEFDAVRRDVLNRLPPEVLMYLDCPIQPVPYVERRDVITSSLQMPDFPLTRALIEVLSRVATEARPPAALTSITLFHLLKREIQRCVASPVRSCFGLPHREHCRESNRSSISLRLPMVRLY